MTSTGIALLRVGSDDFYEKMMFPDLDLTGVIGSYVPSSGDIYL